jgi:hypothetical protein
MSQGVRPVWVVQTPLEGEVACDTLREHGIKCGVVEMAIEASRLNPYGSSGAVGDTGLALHVIVAPEDADRAHQILEDYTDLP